MAFLCLICKTFLMEINCLKRKTKKKENQSKEIIKSVAITKQLCCFIKLNIVLAAVDLIRRKVSKNK